MKAIVVSEAGPPENLIVQELPDPKPAANEVLIRVSHSGVNHGDVIRRKRGLFPEHVEPPYVLGFEGVGSVVKVGRQVPDFVEGERVGFLVESGAYGQLVSVPHLQVFKVPDDVTDEMVAASTCVGTTAWHLMRLAGLRKGMSVLIHGAAGGVGSTLVQLCNKRPVRMLSAASSSEKVDFVRNIGGGDVIDYTQGDFGQQVLTLTNGIGVDVIFDCVGKAVVDGNFHCLKRHGQLLYFGSASGHPEFPASKVLMGSIRIQGFVIFHMFAYPKLWQSGVTGLLASLRDGSLIPNIQVLPMSDAAASHRLLEERQVSGKLVLDMS